MELRTTYDSVEVNEFEDMHASMLKIFRSVCALAFHGVIKNKTQFTLKDLKALSIDLPLDTLGVLQAPRQLTEHGPQHSYSFLHYAVQEFLAAYHISKLSSEEQSKEVSQILHNNPLSSVLPFYAGLTKLTNSGVCNILTEVTKHPLDCDAFLARLTQNPDSQFSDSRKLLLALMNCIYESQNKDVCELVNFLPSVPDCRYTHVTISGLTLDPMDCISLGYFFANKQLDKICTVELGHCCVGDLGIEVLMKELSQGCMPKESVGVSLSFYGKEYSYHGVKCISEALSQTSIVRGLLFTGWNWCGLDATASLTCLIEGLCRSKCLQVVLHGCVSYKHTYHLPLLIAFGDLHHLDLSFNDIGNSSTMSLLAQALKYNRTLEGLNMNDCNINDGGLQHLGSALQDNETLTFLLIPWNPFSSEALSYFLWKLSTACSRLTILQIDPKQWKPEYSNIVEKINKGRLLLHIAPLEINVNFESQACYRSRYNSLPKSLILSSRKHY